MKRTIIVLVMLGAVLAVLTASVVQAAPPPTTTTTTTTTLPPAQPTRGVIQCVPNGNTDWSDWIQFGTHTRLAVNGSVAPGASSYPALGIQFSADGTNPLPDNNTTALSVELVRIYDVSVIWPYIRLRCQHGYDGTPVIVWMLT
jgi:hypothetical protein